MPPFFAVPGCFPVSCPSRLPGGAEEFVGPRTGRTRRPERGALGVGFAQPLREPSGQPPHHLRMLLRQIMLLADVGGGCRRAAAVPSPRCRSGGSLLRARPNRPRSPPPDSGSRPRGSGSARRSDAHTVWRGCAARRRNCARRLLAGSVSLHAAISRIVGKKSSIITGWSHVVAAPRHAGPDDDHRLADPAEGRPSPCRPLPASSGRGSQPPDGRCSAPARRCPT